MKLKRKTKVILVLALVIVLALFVFFLIKKTKESTVTKKEAVNEIEEYGYTLKSGASQDYKERFEKLKTVLESEEVDEEEYVTLISEMFVLDFFTLEDKVAKTDVGGTDFLYEGVKEDFLEKAMDTYYKYLETNLDGKRDQDLPVVTNPSVTEVTQEAFAYGNENDENAYVVTISWDYQVDLGYQEEAELIFIHDEKKLSLVELNEIESDR